MRQRFVLVALAITSMVVLSFVVPLAILVRDVAEDRALVAAERQAQSIAALLLLVGPEGDPAVVAQVTRAQRTEPGDVTVFLSDGETVGDEADEDSIVRQARLLGESLRTETDGGQVLAVPVATNEGTSVVRIFVPNEELRANIGQAWIVLGSLGLGMILLSVLAADRLAPEGGSGAVFRGCDVGSSRARDGSATGRIRGSSHRVLDALSPRPDPACGNTFA